MLHLNSDHTAWTEMWFYVASVCGCSLYTLLILYIQHVHIITFNLNLLREKHWNKCMFTELLFFLSTPRRSCFNKHCIIIKTTRQSFTKCLFSWMVIFSLASTGPAHNCIIKTIMQKEYYVSWGPQLTFHYISFCSMKIKNIWIPPSLLLAHSDSRLVWTLCVSNQTLLPVPPCFHKKSDRKWKCLIKQWTEFTETLQKVITGWRVDHIQDGCLNW